MHTSMRLPRKSASQRIAKSALSLRDLLKQRQVALIAGGHESAVIVGAWPTCAAPLLSVRLALLSLLICIRLRLLWLPILLLIKRLFVLILWRPGRQSWPVEVRREVAQRLQQRNAASVARQQAVVQQRVHRAKALLIDQRAANSVGVADGFFDPLACSSPPRPHIRRRSRWLTCVQA